MTKHSQVFASIDPQQLDVVQGGAGPAPVQPAPASPPLLLPKPFTPVAPKPFTPPPQGGPKYSAAWWDIVRARGLFK
jgi:hypothetical protein